MVKIAVIQSQTYYQADVNAPDYDRVEAEVYAQRVIDGAFALMATAVEAGARLLVTIECLNNVPLPTAASQAEFLAVCEPLDGPLMKRFAAFCRETACYVVAGLQLARQGRAYNSAVLFNPQGSVVGIHDKVHLPAGEERHITPGSSYEVFPTEFGNIGMLVCWDMQYPEAARELALGGADLIACPTWGWENLYGLCRAYENSVTIAAAMGAYHGEVWAACDPSCIVDNMGRLLAVASRRGAHYVMADIDLRTEPEPQYGAGEVTGMTSMRQIRFSQRRTDTYRRVIMPDPPLAKRYRK